MIIIQANIFYNSPVALLFAGGAQDSKSQYYTDEINCCLLTHHLCEMGYQQDNIMCFVEGDIFESSLLPPFTANQIRISKEMILCSYHIFKTYLGFTIFEGSLNNPSIFLFAIIKAVMDAKAPVLIFFSNHGGNDTLSFPYPNAKNESKVDQQSFIELCDALETFKKNVLFILDCCSSEEYVSFDQASHYEFIHFITSTSSMNQTVIPDLAKSDSLNPMNVVNSQEIKLSSKFTRFLLDSIHSITPRTKLNEFVDIINSKGNADFKAKLRSNNPTIPVSFFLQAPLFKYINYAELADTYQLENEIQPSYQFGRMIEPNLNEEPNLEKEEEIFYF